jgi:hypothetical protein
VTPPSQQHHRAPHQPSQHLRCASLRSTQLPLPLPRRRALLPPPLLQPSRSHSANLPTVDEENENETADLLDTLEAEENARRATAEAAALSTYLANSATVTD